MHHIFLTTRTPNPPRYSRQGALQLGEPSSPLRGKTWTPPARRTSLSVWEESPAKCTPPPPPPSSLAPLLDFPTASLYIPSTPHLSPNPLHAFIFLFSPSPNSFSPAPACHLAPPSPAKRVATRARRFPLTCCRWWSAMGRTPVRKLLPRSSTRRIPKSVNSHLMAASCGKEHPTPPNAGEPTNSQSF